MVTEIVTNAMLLALPADLLYLYYAGGWIEPNSVILTIELTVLYLTLIFAVWRLYRYIKGLNRRDRRG